MTSEIGIMNQKGIALAADSAVTIGSSKVYNNAIKLFTLDSQHDVGIMIYGSATINNVPWEVVIKAYREELKDKVKDRLVDYKRSFIDFIQKKHDLFPRTNTFIVNNYIIDYLNILAKNLNILANDSKNKNIPPLELLNRIVDSQSEFEPKKDFAEKIDEKTFYSDNKTIIENYIKSRFNFHVSEELNKKIEKNIYNFLKSVIFSSNLTGVVFAGYGKKEFFPQLVSFITDGLYNYILKFADEKNIDGKEYTGLYPFAQKDMAETVLSGIDPGLQSYIEYENENIKKGIIGIVGDKAKKEIENIFKSGQKEIEKYKQESITSPIINMTTNLSLGELAVMAETFVSLTSFKRKFSGDMQTVGGPIDVLVISKCDGPIWIKRKEYFDQEINEGYKLRRK